MLRRQLEFSSKIKLVTTGSTTAHMDPGIEDEEAAGLNINSERSKIAPDIKNISKNGGPKF